jgi:DNA-binding response OmpR family regulator
MLETKKILVAEDDNGITDVIELILSDAGYQTLTTRDGRKVYKLLEERPAAVLLDVRLSGEDGRNICRKIKSSKDFSDIPVILFSADQNIESIAKESGADAFIRKPFDIDELLSLVKHVIH